MMILIEKEEFDKILEDVRLIKNEVEKQNKKILEIIDALEIVFKENRKLNEEGFPSVDFDEVQEPEYTMREAVIVNIEYEIMSRIKEILEKYK